MSSAKQRRRTRERKERQVAAFADLKLALAKAGQPIDPRVDFRMVRHPMKQKIIETWKNRGPK